VTQSYRLGRTRVFFRAGQLDAVESIMSKDMSGAGQREAVKRALEQALEDRLVDYEWSASVCSESSLIYPTTYTVGKRRWLSSKR